MGDKIYLCLAFELMGKYSNVILYNYDTNMILGCAHNVGAEKSREREMYGGLPYVYPPKQNKADILNYHGEVDYANLPRDFYWFSKGFASQCIRKSLDSIKYFVGLRNLTPAISKDYREYSLYSDLIKEMKEELEDGILKPDSIVQILRDETRSVYHPIIDWYYDDKKVVEDTTIEFDDTEEDKQFKREYISRYIDDKPKLQPITVSAMLVAMEDVNNIV